MNRTIARTTAFVILLSSAWSPCRGQDPAPRGEVLEDLWSVVRLGDRDLGYYHSVTTKTAEPEPVIETRIECKLVMRRMGGSVEIEQLSISRENPAGQLLSMRYVGSMSNQKSEVDVTFSGDEARIRTVLMGRERERVVEVPPETIGPYQLHRLGVEKGREPGTAWEATTFVAETQTVTDVYTEVVGPETVELLDGETAKLTKVVTEMDAVPAPVTTWEDDAGVPHRMLVAMGALRMEMFVTTEERALATVAEDTQLPPDVFEKTLIVAEEFVPHPRHLERAELDIRVIDAGRDVSLPDTTAQRVGDRAADGVVRVSLERVVPPPDRTGTCPLADPPSELAEYLAANTMIQSDEAEIREIAESIVGGEKDAWHAARAIERWVAENVTNKNMDVGFASALEVCRDRSGDCSEHAVLMAALCRAAGIPARVAMGVVYLGGIWGGHAWNEVWIDGAWYPLDSTIGYGFVDPMHLTMSVMSLSDGEFGREFAGVIGLLGNVEISVVSVGFDGEKIPVAGRPAAAVEGNRYSNRLWGLACEKPDGFEFEIKRPARAIRFEILEVEGRDDAGSWSIDVDATDADPRFEWDAVLRRAARDGATAVETAVDGRPARGLDLAGDRRVVFVHADRRLFVFELERAPQGAAADEVFDAFLASVDLDVERR